MIRNDLDVQIAREPWREGVAFRLYQANGEKIAIIETPLTLRTLKDGEDVAEPTFRISEMTAQRLIDMLWDCGFRPTEGSGSAGALAATQKHLADMRALVFKIQPTSGTGGV